MSWISDPDRLERLARYVMDEPSNTLPVEVRDALRDAADRIRSLQERLVKYEHPSSPHPKDSDASGRAGRTV